MSVLCVIVVHKYIFKQHLNSELMQCFFQRRCPEISRAENVNVNVCEPRLVSVSIFLYTRKAFSLLTFQAKVLIVCLWLV